MEIIGEFWSRGGEKFSGDTGEVKFGELPQYHQKIFTPRDQFVDHS